MADKKTKRKVLAVDTSDEPKKVKFVVKSGQTFGLNRLGAGSKIELTVAEALPFADKLEAEDRNTVLPGDATPQELADMGVEQVQFPSAASTDRDVMTPAQRAQTSQTDLGTPEKGKASTTAKSEKTEK